LAGGLVRAVEVDHQSVTSRTLERGPVEVHDLLGFMIEEIQLYADGPHFLHVPEERLACVRVANLLAVLPQPDPDVALPRVVDELPQPALVPLPPEALHPVVFEPQLPSEPRELLHGLERVLAAAVQVLPDGAPRPDPIGVEAFREQPRVGRRREVVYDVAVHERV